MAASIVQTVSKSSKKKAARILERTESPAPSTGSSPADRTIDSQDDFESPYIKELQKNIRNANKKLSHILKTDTILAQHPGKSLDDLVAQRVINADQKAQISKKPALQAQIAQYEEQLVQYQKVHEQYQAKATADRLEWEKSSDKEKADAVTKAKDEFQVSLTENLLLLSQFLRLAAYRREEAKDPESDESQAIEGVLLAIYSGDEKAVSSMKKLIEGSGDQIVSVPGELLQTTYATVNNLAKTYQAPQFGEGAQAPETQEATEAVADPTVQYEVATELAAGDGVLTNGHTHEEAATNGIANASVSDDAANAAAESQWDSSVNKDETSISQEWVDVSVPKESPEPAAEAAEATEATEPTGAVEASKQSWADDHPEVAPTSTDPNDGFHQVQRNRGRQDRENGGSGSGSGGRGRGRGEWRGRGHRGDGRGRGRGNRGGAGGPSRGPRRAEES